MRVSDRGLVYDATNRPAAERIASFDSLYRLKNGDWLCGYHVGKKKHDVDSSIRWSRSKDGGKTWSQVAFRPETTFGGVRGSLAGTEFAEIAPGKLLLFTSWFDRTDPERPLFDPVTEGILHSKLLVAESKDDGETFGAWREIVTSGLTGTALSGPPLQWTDGSLGLAFESFKHYDDPKPAWHCAWIFVSRDGGQTFSERHIVGEDPKHEVFYWDERLIPTKTPGEYIGLFWTHNKSLGKDLNVQFLKASTKDGDRAKSTPSDTGIPGQISSPLLLDDGRILGFVVDRDRPGTMKLWQSKDNGKTWPAGDALTVHIHDEKSKVGNQKEGVDFAEYWDDMRKWSFGHPCSQLIDSKTVLLTFYAGEPDALNIHWAKIDLT